MLSLLDIAERAQKGPKMAERDWDIGLFHTMNQLVKKYEIKYANDGSWFNADPDMADRVFRAAVDFLVEKGIFCLPTSRVVQFSGEEVREAIKAIPEEVPMGEGKDRRIVRQGKLDGKGPQALWPGLHCPFSEDLAALVVMNFAMVGDGAYIEAFNFTHVDGREIIGPAMEAYAARRQLTWMREGVRKAGRPGMAVACYPINTRAAALLAPMDLENGLRRTDGMMLAILPDVKMEMDMLVAAVVYDDYGCFKKNGGGTLIGSFCGGPEGAAIEAVVGRLAGWLVYRAPISNLSIMPLGFTSGDRVHMRQDATWANSVAAEALNRNSNLSYWGGGAGVIDPTSGPGNETFLLHVALSTITTTLNGGHLAGARQARPQMNRSRSPLEVAWCLEVADAVRRTGLTRSTAGPVLDRLAALLEGRALEHGQHILECYDLVSHRPQPAYQQVYQQVKEQVAAAGLDFA